MDSKLFLTWPCGPIEPRNKKGYIKTTVKIQCKFSHKKSHGLAIKETH